MQASASSSRTSKSKRARYPLLAVSLTLVFVTVWFQSAALRLAVPYLLAFDEEATIGDNGLSGGNDPMLSSQSAHAFPGENRFDRFRHDQIPLLDLVNDDPGRNCTDGFVLVRDSGRELLADGISYGSTTRRIPKIIHMTTKSRCMLQQFADNIDRWRFQNYTVLIHDDEAVAKLMDHYFPEFPELQKAAQCVLSGAGKADLWRAVVLWEYGGIYTDIDNAPTRMFNNGSAISDDDEAWFVIEKGGWLSQYFWASTHHHPINYLVVSKIIQRMYTLSNVEAQYIPRSTGPGALKWAFIDFMRNSGGNYYEGGKCKDYKSKYDTVLAGHYTGWDNWTVTAVGKKEKSNWYIMRNSVRFKGAIYKEMNMTHFQDFVRNETVESCFERIYNRDKWSASHGRDDRH